MATLTFFSSALLIMIIMTKGEEVVISNVIPRLDVNGQYVNAHDGCLVQFQNLFYIYGTVYENCTQPGPVCDGECGYFNNTFAVYVSEDLVTWTLLNPNVLPQLSEDNQVVSYWEANVGYNNFTQDYVMVYWSGHYGFVNNSVAVARSPTPEGPFVNAAALNMVGGGVISDTVGLFVDEDGTAYVRYNTRDAPLRHVVERLSSDWASSSGEYGIIFEKQDFPWYDGGGMFRNGATYFVMLSFDCCFCQWGSDALVFVAPAPLGPWAPQPPLPSPHTSMPPLSSTLLTQPKISPLQEHTVFDEPPSNYTNEVNLCATGLNPPSHVADMNINPCSQDFVNGPNFTVPAQQFNVATLRNASGYPYYLYYGERFRSSPDGIKAHDFQAWLPLAFVPFSLNAQSSTWQPEVLLERMVFLDSFALYI